MSTVEAICTVVGTAIALLSTVAGLVWWAYKQGQQRAEDRAKIEALERGLLEIRAEVTTRQRKRRRWLWRWLNG
jgi:hypothetical protein